MSRILTRNPPVLNALANWPRTNNVTTAVVSQGNTNAISNSATAKPKFPANERLVHLLKDINYIVLCSMYGIKQFELEFQFSWLQVNKYEILIPKCQPRRYLETERFHHFVIIYCKKTGLTFFQLSKFIQIWLNELIWSIHVLNSVLGNVHDIATTF